MIPSVHTEELDVKGMHCPNCATDLQEAIGRLNGVSEAAVQFATGKIQVTYNQEKLPRAALTEYVERAGYTLSKSHEESEGTQPLLKRRGVILIVIAGALLSSALLLMVLGLDRELGILQGVSIKISTLLLLTSTLFGGANFARRGFEAIRTLSLGINFLMTVAVIGAIILGEYLEAASLAFLFSVAERLEEYSIDRARNSLRALLKLAPDRARVRRDGLELELPTDQIQIGDIILIRPGERIALDGQVVLGSSSVNQAPITGESVPVEKKPGESVFAGTINEEGYLEVRTTRIAKDTTLAKIIHLVEEAEGQKAPVEKFVDRFAKYYTPSVVALALLVAIIPPLLFAAPIADWLIRSLSLLVISCPCALLISTPVSIVSAITSAARHGVLIKGGVYLEELGKIQAIAIDKTGTLTTGKLEVTDIIPLNGYSAKEIIRTAAALESRSQHPIAQAVLRHFEQTVKGTIPSVQDFQSLTARGVMAKVNGAEHLLGKPELFTNLSFPEEFVQLESQAKTVMAVGRPNQLIGLIAVADKIRPEARQAVSDLQKLGLEVVMITGDNEGTARAVAGELGITHFHAGVLPEQKLGEIKKLLAQHGSVAMVGDGVNDAPALAAASVGIAMGVAGADAALESADVALMSDQLNRLPYLIKLSRKSSGVIQQNIWFSILTKLSLAIGVFPGLVTLVLAVLVGDMGATLAVTGNAMRLARVKE